MGLSADINSLQGVNGAATSMPSKVSASVNDDDTSINTSTSTGTGYAPDSLSTDKGKGLDEEDFLLLLMTQLKNQDPINPMDNTQMMEQMAQLEAIQSNNNIEKAIKELSASFQGSVSAQQNSAQSMTNSTSVSLIGKKIRTKLNDVVFSGIPGEKQSFRINLGNNNSADVQLLDENGTLVTTLHASGKDGTNSATVVWDGTNDKGQTVIAGTYTIAIVGQETDQSLYAFIEDIVQGVGFSSSGARLKIAGREISVANVMDVAPEQAVSGWSSLSPSSAIALIGKTVRVKQNTIIYSAKDNENHQIKVSAAQSSPVTISILDSKGTVVRTMSGVSDKNGSMEFFWNGQSTDGSYVDPGTYTVTITGEETNPGLYCYDEGTVDGINTLNGTTRIRMNGKEISCADIIDISVQS